MFQLENLYVRLNISIASTVDKILVHLVYLELQYYIVLLVVTGSSDSIARVPSPLLEVD